MKYLPLILSIELLAPTLPAKQPKPEVQKSPAETTGKKEKDPPQQIPEDTLFLYHLNFVETNFAPAGRNVARTYQTLQMSSPDVALNIAKLWVTKSEVSLVAFVKSERESGEERIRLKGQYSKEDGERYWTKVNLATDAFYFDHFSQIADMVDEKLKEARAIHEAQTKRIEEMKPETPTPPVSTDGEKPEEMDKSH